MADSITICSAVSSLSDPPVHYADVSGFAGRKFLSFDLHLWAAGSCSITGLTLVGLTTRGDWAQLGLLGLNSDGNVVLSSTDGFMARFDHSRRISKYALLGTPSAAFSAEVCPLENY